jgi:hypothetical protein
VAQIKLNPVAYSVFALARLFLGKPERYDVKLVVKGEAPLFQLGEQGAISADREFLESNAFRLAQGDFYKTEVVQGEPIKGNFNSVARERSGGILLGPTNHHAYQPKLRALYEQRFSRRMSFPEFQRQIEIVADPAVVEQWKEEARNTTTWSTLKEETPASFTNPNETERHFRQHYLSNLVRAMTEGTVDGVTSRQMADRYLRRLVENSWARETRSPSQMMQELSARLRDAGLQIFRHRKGMLFVSTVRPRPFAHEQSGVSAQVRAILELVAANPGINRKDFADKILGEVPESEAEARKLSLASDLHWLISEGYVIEFNDGSLDLPRVKQPKPAEGGERKAETAAPSESAQSTETAVPTEDQREVKPNDIAETVPATVSLQDQPSVESVDASGDAQSPVIPSEVEGSRGETEQ